jgi:hypothetical protein
VVDEQLRAPGEQIRQRDRAVAGLEPELLADGDPGQLLPPPGQLVTAPGVLLLGVEQFQPGGQPFLMRAGLVCGHCGLLFTSEG